MKTDKIGVREKRFDAGPIRCHIFALEVFVALNVIVKNLHVKSPYCVMGNPRANPSQTNNPKCFSEHIRTEKKHWSPSFVFTGTGKSICLRNAMRDCKHECKSMLGNSFSKHARSICHHDIARARCFQINIIKANRVICEYLALLPRSVEYLVINVIGEQTKDAIIFLFFKSPHKFILCEHPIFFTDNKLKPRRLQKRNPRVRNFPCYKYFVCHRYLLYTNANEKPKKNSTIFFQPPVSIKSSREYWLLKYVPYSIQTCVFDLRILFQSLNPFLLLPDRYKNHNAVYLQKHT